MPVRQNIQLQRARCQVSGSCRPVQIAIYRELPNRANT